MAAKSNKKNNPSQSSMTLEEAIEKSRVQVAENADLVTESEAAASAAAAAASQASEAASSSSSASSSDAAAGQSSTPSFEGASGQTEGASTSKASSSDSSAIDSDARAEQGKSAEDAGSTQDADLSDFIRRGIDISGLKENELDENLKIKPEAAEPPKVNPYTDTFSDEEEALPEGKTNDQLTAGQFLRYHRIKRKMSIPEVANEIRARAATVSDIENDSLCEPTSREFAESFILRYGKLFDLDQDDLIARFRRVLSQKVTVIPDEGTRKKFDLQIARSWFMMVLIILVATAGYFVFSAQEASKKSEQGVTIAQESQVAKDKPAVELFASNNNAANAPVIIEDENSGKGPEVRIVDKNTARATAQQRAMQQSAEETNTPNPALSAEAKTPLGLPPGVKQDSPMPEIAANAQKQNTNVSVGSPDNISVMPKNDTAAMMAQAQAQKDAKGAAEADKQKEEQKNKEEADKDNAPALAQKLKDISKSVRVVNRDGLASLNRAEFVITKPMSLKVVDSSGNVLASGSYKKGDTVKVTGIPPITVQISSTDALKISYMGGHISMPAGKQVKFKLPMR